jgi:protein SCO1
MGSTRSIGSIGSVLAFGFMVLVLPAGCRPSEPATKSYELTGQILAVHPEKQSLTIKHQDIPGYMPGMTMTFVARDAAMVEGREPGEMVRATLEVGGTSSRLTALEVTGREPMTAMPAELALAEGLLQKGDALPDATFIDQDGRSRALSEWRGGPVAITFTYTRCPLPEFCPRIDRNFAETAKAIAGDDTLRGQARLLTISFDPGYDTPAVMNAHATKIGADPAVWTFATGTQEQVELFAARFGVAVTRTGDTPEDIVHNLRTIVAGPDGTIRALHSGSEWTAGQLVADLRNAR